jgi:hypothetical protein
MLGDWTCARCLTANAEPTAPTPPGEVQAVVPVAGWSGPSDHPVAAAKPLWRRLPIGMLIFVALIAVGAVGGIVFNAGRSSTGEIDRAGDLTAADLRVGDCFDLKDATATDEIEAVTARPCKDMHQYEMLFVGSLPAGSYPTEQTFEDYMSASCLPAFETYIGRDYDSSVLEIYWLSPTEQGWRIGDRSVQCAVIDPSAGP